MTDTNSTSASQLSDALAAAVETAGHQVVSVSARKRGPASGVIWRTGTVVTADHVIDREEDIKVQSQDGATVSATLVGRDPTTDLAVLSAPSLAADEGIASAGYTAKVGQLVVAVARPGETGLSASFGALSAVGPEWRTWGGGRVDQLLRPDLTFYPGFSGGAIVDMRGQIFGLATSGLSRHMNLAIPVSTVNRVLEQLLESGRIARGYLGVRLQTVAVSDSLRGQLKLDNGKGLLVVGLESEGPAEKAGILVGDILIAIENKLVWESDAVQAILDGESIGKSVNLRLIRGGQELHVPATVGERPARKHGHG